MLLTTRRASETMGLELSIDAEEYARTRLGLQASMRWGHVEITGGIHMGHHYVPQRYLRGFQAPEKPGWVWMYDKGHGTAKILPINHVAQAPGFYEEEVERLLNEFVEIPGNDVIDKVRRGEAIDEGDRGHLTYYVATMIKRVPVARERAYATLPHVLAELVRGVKAGMEQAALAGHIDAPTLDARLAEADAAEVKLRDQPPPEVVETIESPWPYQSMLVSIFHMTWRSLRASGPSLFLISDNPASFFYGFGLGRPESELLFPLCSDVLLHCSWQKGKDTGVQLIKATTR